MANLLTQKQEKFCLNLFAGMSQREAWLNAGYSKNMAVATIDSKACTLAVNGKVRVRLAELRKKAEDASIMSVIERKQRLSEIARAAAPDFQDEGGGINVKKGMPNVAAVSEVTTKSKYNRKNMEPVVITSLKLHNPIQAIAELNKMEKIYSEAPAGSVTNNTQYNIYVIDSETKDLLSQVGERTGRLIEVNSGL